MARLPGINYGTEVRSLGRQDVSGPLRVAAARADAARAWSNTATKIATKIETNDTAEYSAQLSNELSELNAYVQNTKEYTVDELDEIGVEYDAKDRETIPAHEVAIDFYKAVATQIHKRNSSQVSKKGRSVLERVYASKYTTGISDVTAIALRHGYNYTMAKTKLSFDQAINAGDLESATNIAETALANGTWGPDYYVAKMAAAPGEVALSDYRRGIDAIGSADELEKLRNRALADLSLSPAQTNDIYNKSLTKQSKIEKEVEEQIKEKANEASSFQLNDLTSSITEGLSLTAAEMMAEIRTMTLSDRKTAMTVWRSSKNAPANHQSDPDALAIANAAVQATVVDDNSGRTFRERRVDVLNDLILMADPTTRELSVSDFRALTNDLNKVASAAINTPEYRAVEDDIYLMFTGGSKSMVNLGGGEHTVGMSQVLAELNNHALERGPQFDPATWWEKRKPEVASKKYKRNEEKFRKIKASNHIVTNSQGDYDLPATVRNLNEQVKRGDITQQKMNGILSEARKLQDEREQLKAIIGNMGNME